MSYMCAPKLIDLPSQSVTLRIAYLCINFAHSRYAGLSYILYQFMH